MFQTLRNNSQQHAKGCENGRSMSIQQFWELLAEIGRLTNNGDGY